MTVIHHPSDLTLADWAAGTLDEARALVVSSHLARCPHCRTAVGMFESVGGALLDDALPAEIAPDALDRALANLGAPEAPPIGPPRTDAAMISGYALGRWRWLGRGIQWRQVDLPSADGVRVFMLNAQPGTRLPGHRHTGTEWTCVFQGAFQHEHGRYGPGDFDEADQTVEHHPVVEMGEACICLVALQGSIRLEGFLGRLLQPLVRI
ncbi:MAG: ChrR family anti-sigma-E factor [Xanthobacteraceae bacterium]|jgi:putative transcriptional regulator